MALAGVIFAGSCFLLCTVQLYAQIGDTATSLVENACSNSGDCYPAGLNETMVPAEYINCADQKCVCSDCFYATNSYKSCAYQRCWEYDKTTQVCIDLRKEQRTAFFLSLFLSVLGAANFYIERYDLGVIQLCSFVLLPFILLCFLFVTCRVIDRVHCLSQLLDHCSVDAMVMWPLLVLPCVWILLNLMWWVADIVTFAENLRTSRDGCPLKHNL